MQYVGLDAHLRTSTFCVLDARGRKVMTRTVKGSWTAVCTELERITNDEAFSGFPMFSPDGRYLAFSSNRYGSAEGETNVFVAEWVEDLDR